MCTFGFFQTCESSASHKKRDFVGLPPMTIVNTCDDMCYACVACGSADVQTVWHQRCQQIGFHSYLSGSFGVCQCRAFWHFLGDLQVSLDEWK
mmetsp:Transcript_10374/g.17698  ORF Transcript_10374/g.17698 Transcript_10374/m.17698 type:complete len:93 (-) Transcript_10374:14-292(-)